MAQNHSPTWDRKFGNLYQVIWKTFHPSQPSKKLLNNGSHMLVHVSFVEPTPVRSVSFNLWIQNRLFLHGFLVSSIYLSIYIYIYIIFIYYIYIYIYYIYIYIYVCVCVWVCVCVIFNFMLLEHYLMQFYWSFYTSVN